MAQLQPLPFDPSAESQAAADRIIRRLEAVYRFAEATHRRAAQAVTSAVKPAGAITTGTPSAFPIDRELPLPAFAQDIATLSGADIGTATHIVMQWLDVKRPCRGDDLESQISDLIRRGHLTPAQAGAVDRAGIEWLMDSAAGKIMRSAKSLLREVPFCLLPGDAALAGRPDLDVLDRTVLRGTIDLLAIDDRDRASIIDYKTDRVFGDDVLARAAGYEKQLLVYGEAVRRLAKRPVVGCWLAFLTPRQLRRVGNTSGSQAIIDAVVDEQ